MPQPRAILEGHRFGRLLVTRFLEVKDGHSWFETNCDCGTVVVVRGTDLIGGTKRKCSSDCKYQTPRARISFTTIGQRGTVERKVSSDVQQNLEVDSKTV
jgi:hypothetical protein